MATNDSNREASAPAPTTATMAMESASAAVEKKRRRRRRRQDKPPVAARLVLDDQIKGDVGFLSEDLFHELFPHGELTMTTECRSTGTY
jgi:peroxin-6